MEPTCFDAKLMESRIATTMLIADRYLDAARIKMESLKQELEVTDMEVELWKLDNCHCSENWPGCYPCMFARSRLEAERQRPMKNLGDRISHLEHVVQNLFNLSNNRSLDIKLKHVRDAMDKLTDLLRIY